MKPTAKNMLKDLRTMIEQVQFSFKKAARITAGEEWFSYDNMYQDSLIRKR